MSDREDLRDWFQAVLDATGWSARTWAENAKTSPTNITRMIARPQDASMPRLDTLLKLARAVPQHVAITPPPFVAEAQEAAQIEGAVAKAVERVAHAPSAEPPTESQLNLWAIIEQTFEIAKADGRLQELSGREFRQRVQIGLAAFERASRDLAADSQ